MTVAMMVYKNSNEKPFELKPLFCSTKQLALLKPVSFLATNYLKHHKPINKKLLDLLNFQ